MTFLILAPLAIGLMVAAGSRRSVFSAAILAFARSMDTTPLHAGIHRPRGHEIH